MFKQALYTYWNSLHPRNLKYIIEKRWMTFIFLFVLLPSFGEIKEYGVGAFYPFTIFLPIVLMKMSNLANKLYIPKALFLSPMQQKEREAYTIWLIVIKIGASMLLGLLIQMAWNIGFSISVTDVLVYEFVYLSYGIAEYFCVEGTFDDGNKVEHGMRTKEGDVTYSTCNIINIAGVWLICMGLVPLVVEEQTIVSMWGSEVDPFVVFAIVIMFVSNIYIVIRQTRDMLDTVCKFELDIKLEK